MTKTDAKVEGFSIKPLPTSCPALLLWIHARRRLERTPDAGIPLAGWEWIEPGESHAPTRAMGRPMWCVLHHSSPLQPLVRFVHYQSDWDGARGCHHCRDAWNYCTYGWVGGLDKLQ